MRHMFLVLHEERLLQKLFKCNLGIICTCFNSYHFNKPELIAYRLCGNIVIII